MKIIIIQDYLRSGGTERQSVLLANGFADAGHTTTLITFRPGGPLASTVSSKVERRALQPFDLHLDWFAPGLSRAVATIAPDIVLCMGRMANCYGGPLAKSAHSVVSTMRTGKPLPALFRRSLKKTTHIIANSHAAKAHLADHYEVNAQKINVIYNSLVFPATPNPTHRDELRNQHGAAEHTSVFLDVAMLRPEKNQRELIAIAAGLPNSFAWQLWLAGAGSELARCQQYAVEMGVEDRVKFFGLTADPAPLYVAADLAVHASHRESLSNFLIEAQAHGLPVVAYAAQGVDECFIPNDTGVSLPFGDQEGFRKAILKYGQPDPERQERARSFARTTFDPNRQIQIYLDLFARLTSS